MTGLKLCVGAVLLGGSGLVAQFVPGVPDDWKSWPATAILGFVTLAALSCMVLSAKGTGKALIQIATVQGKMDAREQERNKRLDELCQKWGQTNDHLLSLNANLKARPCLWGEEERRSAERQEAREIRQEAREIKREEEGAVTR